MNYSKYGLTHGIISAQNFLIYFITGILIFLHARILSQCPDIYLYYVVYRGAEDLRDSYLRDS